MKYSTLQKIVTDEARQLYDNVGHSGGWGDGFLVQYGGSKSLLTRLQEFKMTLIFKYDLRPSEYTQLDNMDIEEPKEFQDILTKYKIKLAKDIKL